MANVDAPHGLRPLYHFQGAPWGANEYDKDSGEATAIFIGDAVNREADGNIEAASATPGTTRYSGVSLNHGGASLATKHLVIDDPMMVFEAQDNNDTDGFAEVDMGLLVNLELNAGNATTLLSGHELDESTVNTTATLDAKMLRKLNVPDNAYGAFCRVEVLINKHRMNPEVAGV